MSTVARSHAFLTDLAQRRQAVLDRLASAETERAARFILALFTQSAKAGHSALDEGTVVALAKRAGIALEVDMIPTGDDGEACLSEMLFSTPSSPDHIQTLNGLLARGFAASLEPLPAAERRALTLRVVKLLPGVERLGPFVLSDFIDQACTEEDAVRFWQIYVDRVAAEVARRTADTPPSKEPWLFSELLRLHDRGPSIADARGWVALNKHVNRALRISRHRWRFVRAIAEKCADPTMLHYLCTAPAMAEDPEVVAVFLERGDAKLISCALFTLQIRPEQDAAVSRVLAHFQDRPLPEIGERLQEIYAQLHLPRAPSALLRRLMFGVRRIVQGHVGDGAPVEALLGSVANDARALRQALILAHSIPAGGRVSLPQHRHLLERVVGVWFQAFTPGGVLHPLNDDVFRAAVGRSVVILLRSGLGEVAERFESFGMELSGRARRWGAKDERRRKQILARFLSVYGHTMLGIARDADRDARLADVAHNLYTALIRVYLAHPTTARGMGWFGAVEYVVPTLFPDLSRGEAAPERQAEAARLVAGVERDRRRATSAIPLPATVGQQVSEPPAAHGPELDPAPVRRVGQVETPVQVLERAPTAGASALRAYLGIEALAHAGRSLLRLLGRRTSGRAVLTPEAVHVEAETRFMGRPAVELTDSINLEHLTSIRIGRRMRTFHLVLGGSVLVGSAVFGGHLAFIGLRAGELGTGLLGLGTVGLGLVFDAAMTRLAELGKRAVVVELFAAGRARPLALQVDTVEGAGFLDAVLAADARRRELELYARWAAQDEAWGDNDEVIRTDSTQPVLPMGLLGGGTPAEPTPEVPAKAEGASAAPDPGEGEIDDRPTLETPSIEGLAQLAGMLDGGAEDVQTLVSDPLFDPTTQPVAEAAGPLEGAAEAEEWPRDDIEN